MAKRKSNQNQTEVTNNASDAEFGIEYTPSKKDGKRVAREGETTNK
jgi:hypothetical protein